MFTRLRNTVHILSYREEKTPPHLTPEIEFEEYKPVKHSKIADFLAKTVGLFIVLTVVGFTISWATRAITNIFQKPSVSVATVGVMGGLIALLLERISGSIRLFLARHFRIILIPHLGHKIEETYRILRG